MIAVVSPPRRITGEITVPGDKSVSHRALILSALAPGTSRIENLLKAQDCFSTVSCLRMLGAEINFLEDHVEVMGRGLRLKPPAGILNAGNSGTTARLLLGVLAGQPMVCRLKGDESLNRRPMKRVVDPLSRMGAEIQGKSGGDSLPLRIKGGSLEPLEYVMEVASAQVKSAILLAALFARGKTVVSEPAPTRDHTEKMLNLFGVSVEEKGNNRAIEGPASLKSTMVKVPGDISSAIFMAVAAVVIPGSEITIKDVGINPTRTGSLEILEEMGADISLLNHRWFGNEPVADLHVRGGRQLDGVTIEKNMIPRLVDEIPALSVAAMVARGKTEIKGAGELRVKETDRISALAREMGRLGAVVHQMPDGLILEGEQKLTGNICHSHGDHRLAMCLALAGLLAEGETSIKDFEVVNVSFPGFFQSLRDLLDF